MPPVSNSIVSAKEALQCLKDGNKRFVSTINGEGSFDKIIDVAELPRDQKPFAVIVGCADSRVPAEIVFDQGVGDLFVVRVAGNIVAPSQIGSVEYAVEHLGAELVVVLGHTHCGAVSVTVKEILNSASHDSRNIRSIVDRIWPAVKTLCETDLKHDEEKLIEFAVRANVRNSVDHLRHGSWVLEKAMEENRLLVTAAEYCVETGVVDFFDS